MPIYSVFFPWKIVIFHSYVSLPEGDNFWLVIEPVGASEWAILSYVHIPNQKCGALS